MTAPSLPNGWTLVPIRETVVPSGSRNPKKEGAGSFRYVDVGALDNTRQVIGSAKDVAKPDAPSRARMLIKKGDVLFCLVRPYLKNIAVVPRELDGEVASTAYCVLRPVACMDSRFLFFQIVRESFIHSIPTYGNSPPSARDDEFMEMPICVAPLPEQRRIVAKIEELFSDLDAGVAALERVRANLKRYRAAVLKAAIEGRLTEEWRKQHPVTEPAAKLLERILAERRAKWEQDQLRKFKEAEKTPPKEWKEKYKQPGQPDIASLPELPAGWEWAIADQLCAQITDGEHIQPPYQPLGKPMLTATHVRGDGVRFENVGMISEEAFEKCLKRCAPSAGDVLIVSVGATTGRAGVVPPSEPFAIVRSVLLLKPLVPSKFVLRWIQSVWCQQWIARASGASAQAHFYISDTKRMPVPVPPLAEQVEIVAEVDRRLSVADAAEMQVEHALQRATRLRQAILKRAFEGKLVPQDPADEPAAAMLERIRAAEAGGSKSQYAVLRNRRNGAVTHVRPRSRARA